MMTSDHTFHKRFHTTRAEAGYPPVVHATTQARFWITAADQVKLPVNGEAITP